MKPNKLLVKNTKREAERAVQAFNLNQEEWMTSGVGQALAGHRFDKIVVDVNTAAMSKFQRRKFIDWYDHSLKLKLPPNKQIINL